MNRILLEVEKPSCLSSLGELRRTLIQVTQAVVPEQATRNAMALCLSETATNLIKHNHCKTITLRFGQDSSSWWLELLDDGESWEPQPPDDDAILDLLGENESGRGIALIYRLCDTLEYQGKDDLHHPSARKNRLRMQWFRPERKNQPKILIVEDDNALRRLYSSYLSQAFAVEHAANGHQALEHLKQGGIDLVLSDIHMPGMNGLHLRQQLARTNETELVPFIFLTAATDNDIQQQANGLGIDDYLVKPVNKDQLIQSVQRVLERSQQIYHQLTNRIESRITSALTPTPPATAHGWRLCVATRNTGIGGGDLLLHQNGKAQLTLVLADIMGHDDSAKFFAYAYGGYLRGLMHSAAPQSSPAELLATLSNYAFQDNLLSQTMLTACIITLADNGQLTLAVAGHPPPLRINRQGSETLEANGVLPGLLAETVYQCKQYHLDHGERIAFYTDGLFESGADAQIRQTLETSIVQSLSNSSSEPIETALNMAISEFDRYAGTPPKDDALLLLAEPIAICEAK